MKNHSSIIKLLGNKPPLLADVRRPPDRRDISLRWLSGTFLTGITACTLMGIALYVAVDGRERLVLPAGFFEGSTQSASDETRIGKNTRLVPVAIIAKPAGREVMRLSTTLKIDNLDVVRRKLFTRLKISLAENHSTKQTYPRFSPLKIFAPIKKTNQPITQTGILYGADVDSELSLRTIDFPLTSIEYNYATSMDDREAEENARINGAVLSAGVHQVASLQYVDPSRFSSSDNKQLGLDSYARVITENVSIADIFNENTPSANYLEDIIPVYSAQKISTALKEKEYDTDTSNNAVDALSRALGSKTLAKNDVLRIGLLDQGEQKTIYRLSVYRADAHLTTIATNDSGYFIEAREPSSLDAITNIFKNKNVPIIAKGKLPTVYDSIYRASLANGAGMRITKQIIRLLSSSVDFRASTRSSDTLQAFYSTDDPEGNATEQSQLLYLSANIGNAKIRLYRFQEDINLPADYFRADGRSGKAFLIRNPVPGGRFRSPFGKRFHPVYKYKKMHWGVDWSAPRGTPIISSGNGTVIKAGWHSGGYGRQTVIKHANGYTSSYSHQTRIAKSVVEGARVKQGQIIGYVGSTGLSTGPHLHYELIVNGTKVNPMRVRLPDAKILKDKMLEKFNGERKQIDTLLGTENDLELAKR